MNENDKNKLNSAFEDIDDKFLDEAAHPIRANRRTVISRLVAACAVFALIALPLSYFLVRNHWQLPLPIPPEETEGAEPLSSDSEPEALGTSTPDVAPETTPEETVGVETTPPFVLPEAPLPTVTVTSNGKTKEMTSFCVGGSYTDGNHEASFDGYCAQDGLNGVGGKSFETVFFNPDDFSINLTGVTVGGYTVYKITGDSNSKYPEFELSPIEINDISEMADYPGDYYIVISARYKDEIWNLSVDYAIRLYVSAADGEITRIPGGSIYNVLEVSAGGKTVTLKKYMVFEERYDDLSHDHGWIFADGLGFENGFSMDPEGIPEIEYSPDISLELQTNSTLHSITLWSGDPKAPSTQTISISSIEEIASYPGTWYAVFSVTNTGAYVKAPDGSAYERACHDHVVKITVPPINSTVTVSSGYQTVDTKSFLLGGAVYDPASDSFMFCSGNGFYSAVIAEKAKDLNVFSITRGSEIGYTLPTNATLISITVYDAEYNKLAISSEIGVDFTRLAELPVGKYYVSLDVYYEGYYYPDHDMHEYSYFNKAFTLVIYDDTTPIPERFIDMHEVELVSFMTSNVGGDNATLYYISAEKKHVFINALAALEFTSADPIPYNEFLPPVGGRADHITVVTKDGEDIEFKLLAGKWFMYKDSDLVYELSDDHTDTIDKAILSVEPDRADVLPSGINALLIKTTLFDYTKMTEDRESVEKLRAALRNISLMPIADNPMDANSSDMVWTIYSANYRWFADFIGLDYLCINGIWYSISEESRSVIENAVSSLVSDYAVTEYNRDEAIALLRKGMTQSEVEALLGWPTNGKYYEFNDGQVVEVIYGDSVLVDIYYRNEWCGQVISVFGGGK